MESYLINQIPDELNIEESDDNSLKEEKDYESDFQNESSFISQNEINESQLSSIKNNVQFDLNFLDFIRKENNIIPKDEINKKKDKNYVGRKKIREEFDINDTKKDKILNFKHYEPNLNYLISNSYKNNYKNEIDYNLYNFKVENKYSFEEQMNNLNLEESKIGIIDNEFINSKFLNDNINKKDNKNNININKYIIKPKNFINYYTKNKTHQNELNNCNKKSKFFESLNNDNIYSKISINEEEESIDMKYSKSKNVFSCFLDLGNKNVNKSNEYNCIMDINI